MVIAGRQIAVIWYFTPKCKAYGNLEEWKNVSHIKLKKTWTVKHVNYHAKFWFSFRDLAKKNNVPHCVNAATFKLRNTGGKSVFQSDHNPVIKVIKGVYFYAWTKQLHFKLIYYLQHSV